MTTPSHPNHQLHKISRGFYAGRINDQTVLATGERGEWIVSIDGEPFGTCPSIADAAFQVWAATLDTRWTDR